MTALLRTHVADGPCWCETDPNYVDHEFDPEPVELVLARDETLAGIPDVKRVERLSLNPGDTLVVHFNAERLTTADAEAIKDKVRAITGHERILILVGGHTLEVLEAPQ